MTSEVEVTLSAENSLINLVFGAASLISEAAFAAKCLTSFWCSSLKT